MSSIIKNENINNVIEPQTDNGENEECTAVSGKGITEENVNVENKTPECRASTKQIVLDHSSSEGEIDKELITEDSAVIHDIKKAEYKSSTITCEEPLSTEIVTDSDYDAKDISYENDVAIYTNPSTGHQFQWDIESNQWNLRQNNGSYGFEDDTHTYIDADGVKFEWDKDKSAWFPKIDDDFMALYQMNYGFNTETAETKPVVEKPKIEKIKDVLPGEKRKPSEPKWFQQDQEENTKVYVSNLPLDITEEEFMEVMQKCGIIMRDPVTNEMRMKLYMEPNTKVIKGDGLCTYIRKESVDLALKLIDGSELRGKTIKVELAKFQMKGDYDPKLKPKSKKRKEKIKLKKQQEKMFDWRPEKMIGERAKHERIVIIKNVFESKMFDHDVGLILEFQQDLREECTKCGEVRKVILFDRHPEGVAQINMSGPEEADAVVNLLNGRWFGKRQLTAEIWDGRTKYKIQETDSQITERIGNWDKFLEDDKQDRQDAQEKEEKINE